MALPTVTRVTQRFLGDKKANLFHDLYNESDACGVIDILAGKRAMRFIPDTLDRALGDEYDPCPHCFDLEGLQLESEDEKTGAAAAAGDEDGAGEDGAGGKS